MRKYIYTNYNGLKKHYYRTKHIRKHYIIFIYQFIALLLLFQIDWADYYYLFGDLIPLIVCSSRLK